jgi:hypothetical protein
MFGFTLIILCPVCTDSGKKFCKLIYECLQSTYVYKALVKNKVHLVQKFNKPAVVLYMIENWPSNFPK